MSKDIYESPLSSRYASQYMLHLFSPDMRFQTWRKLWVALARAEHELGLPVSAEQVSELEAHISDIDYAVAEQFFKYLVPQTFRHERIIRGRKQRRARLQRHIFCLRFIFAVYKHPTRAEKNIFLFRFRTPYQRFHSRPRQAGMRRT